MIARHGGLAAGMFLAALFGAAGSGFAADKVKVVASLPEFGRIAEAVGGDQVEVTVIASGLQDPHFVDPKPSYVLKLRNADLLLANGLELEIGWLPVLIQGARNSRINPGSPGYIDCSAGVPVLEVPTTVLTRAEGDVHPRGNPHYMTDPLNAKIVAATIAEALKRAAPEHAETFDGRKKDFQRSIDEAMFGRALVELVGGAKLDRLCRAGGLEAFLEGEKDGDTALAAKLGGWMARMRPLKGRKIVFYHRSYSYFAARFGLETPDFIEIRPGIQPGPAHLEALVGRVQAEKIAVVAMHGFQEEKIARTVAQKGGAKLVILPLSVGGAAGTEDTVKLLDHVTEALAAAFQGA